MISIDGWQKVQQDMKSGECLELHQYALSFMLIACISRHAGMLFMIQKTQDEAIRTVVRSIAKLGLKNGPSIIKDEVRVDDFCRQTVLNRFATGGRQLRRILDAMTK